MMLLPTTFPKLNPVLPEVAARIFTNNSGVEVPNATMVSPITRFGMFRLFATDVAPSTSHEAPKMSGAKPVNDKKRFSIELV